MTNNTVNTISIIELFFEKKKEEIIYENQYLYTIPLYQRTYRWNTELCEILYNDITIKNSNQYNFGFITLASIPESENEYDVVDGQQRLVSIYLLYLSLYKVINNLNGNTDDYILLSNFAKANIPFIADEMTLTTLEIVKNNSVQEGELYCDGCNKHVFDNYIKFNNLFTSSVNGLTEKNKKIAKLISFFDIISEQTIHVLKYSQRKHALNSFIAINMKSEELDSFEIFSALLLSKIDSEEKQYRTKLDEIYKLFTKLESVFFKFEAFILNMIWTQYKKYFYYCDDIDLIKREIRTEMPNHYVETQIHLASEAKAFINHIINVSNIYIKTINGDLSWIKSEIKDEDFKDLLNSRISQIEYILKQKTLKLPIIINRYILAIINIFYSYIKQDAELQLNNSTIEILTRELMFTLVQGVILNLTGSIRISQEFQSIKKSYDIVKLRKAWVQEGDIESDSLFKNKKINNYAHQTRILDPNKIPLIKILYQLNSSINNSRLNSLKQIYTDSLLPENTEHFFIDKSRKTNFLSVNSLSYNAFEIPESINTEFAQKELKNFISKAERILEKDKTEYKKYYWFYKYVEISKNTFDSLSHDELNMSESNFNRIKTYYTSDIKIQIDDKENLVQFHCHLLREMKSKINQDIIEKINIFEYECPIIRRL